MINVPGCAPVGDNFTETVFAILLFLQGLGPLPAFDELGRPAWLFKETVHQGCTRAGYYEEGTFATSTAIPSAWWSSDAGARSSTATSSSAGRSITWAAA